MSIYTRATVLEILKASFHQFAHFDYAEKFTDNEEDERASIYRYVRNTLDMDTSWRMFLSYTTKGNTENPTLYKPDMVFLHSEDNHKTEKVELFVEIKNWPEEEAIINDIGKLLKLKEHFSKYDPDIIFLAILGHNFTDKSIDNIKSEIRKKIQTETSVHLCFEKHDGLFKGPWINERNTDPWRVTLRGE